MRRLASALLCLLLVLAVVRAPAQEGDVAAEIAAANQRGFTLLRQGDYAAAVALAEETLVRAEEALGPEHPDTLTIVDNLPVLYDAQGRLGEAEALTRWAVDARERVLGPEHPDTLTSVNNLAGLYQGQGRLGEAEPLYRRALEARERVLGPEHPDTLTSVKNLAALYQAQGRLGEAEQLYLRAFDTRERLLGREDPETLASINNLADLYRMQGRFGAAEEVYWSAQQTMEEVLGPQHPLTLRNMNDLAGLYQAQARFGESEELYRLVLARSDEGPGLPPSDEMSVRAGLAALLWHADSPSKALQALREADHRLDAWIESALRATRSASGRREAVEAVGIYQDAAYSLALFHPSPETTGFAFDLLLRWKKRLAQDDAIFNNIARASRDPNLMPAIEAVRSSRAALSAAAVDSSVTRDARERLVEALDAAEAELRARSEIYARYQRGGEARSEDVRLVLSRDHALVELKLFRPYEFETSGFGPRRLLAGVLRADGAPVLVDLGEAAPLLALQRQMIDPAARAEAGATQADVARALHAALLAPLAPHLDGVERLHVAPDGPLHALPWAALLGPDGTRLLDVYDLRLLQTGRDLVVRDRPAFGHGLVAVGGVDFGPMPARAAQETAFLIPAGGAEDPDARAAAGALRAGGLGGFAALPYSGIEAEQIAADYALFRASEPPPVVLAGTDATEGALKRLAAPPRVLHLATHGYYLDERIVPGRPLLQAGVTLAGANRGLAGEIGPDGENGILHAVEAQTLNLYGTELVVLSACETGQGAFDYSEGLEGLPRAFYVAGAQNVLVALWNIDDALTQRFMSRFYRHWLTQSGPSDPGAALRAAQREFAASADPAEADPATWAAFVLFEG